MSDTTTIGFPEAAHRLGVSVRVLRQAIRAGRLTAPAHLPATATLSAEWLAGAQAQAKAAPKTFSRVTAQKVPPFARYEGTSAWRKYANRVREFNHFTRQARQAQQAGA